MNSFIPNNVLACFNTALLKKKKNQKKSHGF